MNELTTTDEFLKLDFNERSDKESLVAMEFQLGNSLWRYPERQVLESKIAEKNGLSAEQVLCTNGGDEAIYILMRMLSESGRMILPLPAFSQYNWGIQSWSLSATTIAANDDLSIDIVGTLKAIKNHAGATVIITRPNNPTGEFILEQDLRKIIEAAASVDSWVFLDEAYIEFSEVQPISGRLLEQYPNLVILRTLSKAYGLAGIRLGYLLGSNALIERFRIRCMPFNISRPSLLIAEKAILNNNQQEVDNYCRKIIENRNQLSDWLVSIGVKLLPSQANFLLLQLDDDLVKAVRSFLEKNKILVKIFEESELRHCLRIGIPYDMSHLLAVVQQALQPKLICMDMDGVLIDTSGSYDQAVMQTVLEISNQEVSLAQIETLRREGGYNNDWVLSQKLLENIGIEVDLDKVTEVFQAIYLGENNDGLVSNETVFVEKSLIDKIEKSIQQKFAIVTGRPRIEAQAGRKLVELESLDLVSLDDVANAKPSPEGIGKLQQQYSKSSWMCGDNPDDMQAAVASNSMAIGIGLKNSEALYQAGADIVINSINDIKDWIA